MFGDSVTSSTASTGCDHWALSVNMMCYYKNPIQKEKYEHRIKTCTEVMVSDEKHPLE